MTLYSNHSWDKVSFDPHFLVIGSIAANMSDNSSSKLISTDLRDILRSWVKDQGYPDIQVAVYPSEVDPTTFDWLNANTSDEVAEASSYEQNFKLVYVAYEKMSADYLKQALKGALPDKDQESLKDAIFSSLAHNATEVIGTIFVAWPYWLT